MSLPVVTNQLPELRSPLEPLHKLGKSLGLELWCKRDDLLPHYYGGNKVRKIFGIMQEAEAQGCDAVVTTGGLQSNHARVAALAAAERGWPATLVLHGETEADASSGNVFIARLAGARVVRVTPDEIAEALEEALAELRAAGFTPFAIPGGGHSVAGALGYVRAADELASQADALGGPADYVILASGTGTTQAGLVVGFERLGWPVRVYGMSVAREGQRGQGVVEKACAELRAHLSSPAPSQPIFFDDRWTGGGYEQVYPDLLETVRRAAAAGLVLDPTYTGKAFHGLSELVREGTVAAGSRVVFWHTGGLMNLLTAPQRELLLP